MRYLLMFSVAALCLGLFNTTTVRAEESKMTGVLIDQHCGEKAMKESDPQAFAEKHEKACCQKCGADGMALMSGGKLYKMDEAGSKKAMNYLKKHDNLNVTVTGEEKDGMLTVKNIKEEKKTEKKES